MLDEDYGDITDLKDGRDIRVTCEKPPGRQWATTSVTPRGSTSPLTTDSEQLTQWTAELPDPSALYEEKSYDQLEKIVNDWLNGDEGTEDTGTERSKTATTETAATTTTSTTSKTLDDAFADLEDI